MEFTTLVPQCDGNGSNSGMEMLTVGETTWPNLIIDRGITEWTVAQANEDWSDDYDELGHVPDEYIENIGSFDVAYDDATIPFLRSYSEEEVNTALVKLLKGSDVAWCAW